MAEQDTHTLVTSSNRGRWSLDSADGHDVTSGERLEVYLGGKWIKGSVEHAGTSGYVFYSDEGGSCALCAGMKVRQ